MTMSMSTNDINSSLIITDMLLNDTSELDVLDNSTGSVTDDDTDKMNWHLEHDDFLKSLVELEDGPLAFEFCIAKDEMMSSASITPRSYDNTESSSCYNNGLFSEDIKPFIPPSESSKFDDAEIKMEFTDTLVKEVKFKFDVDYDEIDNKNGDPNSMEMKPTIIQQPQILKTIPCTVMVTPKQSKRQILISKQLSTPVFIPKISNVKITEVENLNGKTSNAEAFTQLQSINNERRIFGKKNGCMGMKSMTNLKQNKVVSDSGTSDESDSFCPHLNLTNEEKKLMVKEGMKLPSHYPLTNHEEYNLKRIRRKIKNKISARISRKRKKEYVDMLEETVKQFSDENSLLMKNMCALQTENEYLNAALKRLQNVIAPGGTIAQPATCLLVLIISLAIIAAPLKPTITDEKDLMSTKGQDSNTAVPGRLRNLLFSKSKSPPSATNLKDMLNMVSNGSSTDVHSDAIMTELVKLLDFNDLVRNNDHDYSRILMEDYYVPELDDSRTKAAKRSAPPEWVDQLLIPVMKIKRETLVSSDEESY